MELKGLEELREDIIGLNLKAVFYGILTDNPELTYEQQTKAFFWVMEKWLEEGKLKVLNPALCSHVAKDLTKEEIAKLPLHWEASPKEIVDYFRQEWPKEATDQWDDEILFYFLGMPGAIWPMPDGTELISS